MNLVKEKLDLSAVEETALLTLYAKVIESKSDDPIIRDKKAEELVARLNPLLRESNSKMARRLSKFAIDPRLSIHIPLRSKKYDQYAEDFLLRHPQGIIINMGCGMDTRFFRIDNGKVHFFDLDLPELIRFKQQLLQENERYRMIGQSVLDFSWMERVADVKQPVLILAEGVLMYLPEGDVKHLVLELQHRFPESELVCELTNHTWIEGIGGKLARVKMKHQFRMGTDADFKFGVSNARDLESWGAGIQFLGKWFYMDENHPKLGWIRLFRKWKMFQNAQYIAHYQLHAA